MKKIIPLIAMAILLTFTRAVRASGAHIEISPATTHILLQTGKTTSLIYTIANRADPAIISITATSNQTDVIAKNAVTSDTQPFFLGNGEEKKVKFIINSETLEQKDYLWEIIFSAQAATSKDQGITLTHALDIASPILITVTDGAINNEWESETSIKQVVSFPFGERKILFTDSLNKLIGRIIVKNEGKNFILPQGIVEIVGKNIGKRTFQINPSYILSYSQKTIQAEQLETQYCPRDDCAEVTFVLPGFLLGKYSIKTTLRHGTFGSEKVDNIILYAFPFKIIAGFLIVSASIIVVTGTHLKTSKKMQVASSGEPHKSGIA